MAAKQCGSVVTEMKVGKARTPDGMRLYAIGDVHGRDDLLAENHRKIAADLAERPVADHRIVHVGDYVDRGPDSAAVIDRLAGLVDNGHVVCLLGNHDQMILDFLVDPVAAAPMWLMNGGEATLRSYGVDPDGWRDSNRHVTDIRDRFAEVFPAHHRTFIEERPCTIQFGDFFFCHAGIRPRVPLDQQIKQDLIWIRDDFLRYGRQHDVVVVHGHTPSKRPEVRPNRINVDTGAVFGGPLTTLALEGTDHRFL